MSRAIRRPRRARSTLVVAALAALVAPAFAQDPAPQPPPKPEAPAPPQTPPRPPIRPQGAPASRGPVATRPIADVEQYRGGQTAPVTRASQLFELDLAAVDLQSDTLLEIDGQPVRRADLDRQLCLMLGNNEIEQFITGALLRRVKKEMAAAGQPIPEIRISEADVLKKFEEDKKVLPQMRGMTPEEFERQIREVFGWDHYVEFQKQQMEFERFFLPDPPEEWAKRQQEEAKRLDAEHERAKKEKAQAKQEAGEGDAAGEDAKTGEPKREPEADEPPTPAADLSFVPEKTWELLDPSFAGVLKKSYARGQTLHPLFRGGIMTTLRKKLLEGVVVRVAQPGEGDAAIFCGDEPFPASALLALISPRVDDHARRLGLRELLNLTAADLRLERDGALLSEPDAEAAFAAFRKEYSSTLIPAEYVVAALGFNSLWHYRGYFRRKHSYQKLVEAQMTDEKLSRHYDEAGRVFFENGTCIAQVLFVPGDDRAQAKAEMDALLAEIAAGSSFAAVAREKGRFPDGGDVHGGAISPLIRGKLRTTLGESEYTSFLSGYSLADEAFYAAKDDAIVGPIWRDLSPKLTGWIVLHVDRFFTTGSRPPLTDPKARERALDDYVDVTFPRYVNESLSRCRIDLPAASH